MMESESIESVLSIDGVDDDEIPHPHRNSLHPSSHPHHYLHHNFSSAKPQTVSTNNSIVGPTAVAPATSVHELLECPVCTNSMYPPIHQVCFLSFLCSVVLISLYFSQVFCSCVFGDPLLIFLSKCLDVWTLLE